jgi:blue copper oxidase
MKKILLVFSVFGFLHINAQNPLAIPDTLSGSMINLTIRDTVKTWYGSATNTIGVNADYSGPVLILNKGDTVQINVQNLLVDTTTVHWHGLQVSPANDGGPHVTIAPFTTWSPRFRVLDEAGVYWYHGHLHMKTVEHVTRGLAGMIIVRDSVEAQLNLPRTYNTDDFPLILQTQCFDSNKQLVVETVSDSLPLVNGTLNPYLQVPAQVIRLRLLNGAIDRVFNIGLQNNITFYQIASDGGLLSQSMPMTRLRLAPGERAEILIDLGGMQGMQVNLISFNSELPSGIYGAANPAAMGPGVIQGYSSNPLNGADFTLVQLNVIAATANPVLTIPQSLVTLTTYDPSTANSTFSIDLTSQVAGPNGMLNGPFSLNNQAFDIGVINRISYLGDIEIWTIQNNTVIAHPFHLHGLQFYIVSRNGNPPPANEAGRKDVVLVHAQETVIIIMKWEYYTDDMIPYMYHCHMLTHEEHGMMGQLLVLDPVSVTETFNENQFVLYPNPSTGNFFILSDNLNSIITNVKVFDIFGRYVDSVSTMENGTLKISLNNIPDGLYFVQFSVGDVVITRKIIKT